MHHRATTRLVILLGLMLSAGISFSIGFAGATLLTHSARTVDAGAASTPVKPEELDAGATTVVLVCLGLLVVALIGMQRDRRKPTSIVVARYSRRGSPRR